jgi:hypothetical protein
MAHECEFTHKKHEDATDYRSARPNPKLGLLATTPVLKQRRSLMQSTPVVFALKNMQRTRAAKIALSHLGGKSHQ